MSAFYIYAIVFDQDTFGLFATRDEADMSLRQQIAEGGPAWRDCEVVRWRIEGLPEIEEDTPADSPEDKT